MSKSVSVDNTGEQHPKDQTAQPVNAIQEKPEQPVKRKPGRPPKNKKNKVIPREGIVKKPSNHEQPENQQNVIEITYENIGIFRTIFSLMNSYSADYINFYWDHEKLYIYTTSMNKKVNIMVEIFGKMMNRYYVKSPLKISLDCGRLFRIFKGIKENDYVSFYTNAVSKSAHIWVEFNSQDESNVYELSLGAPNDNNNEIFNNIVNKINLSNKHKIAFTVSKEYLKRKMTEIKIHNTSKFSIIHHVIEQKKLISFDFSSNMIGSTGIYKDKNRNTCFIARKFFPSLLKKHRKRLSLIFRKAR